MSVMVEACPLCGKSSTEAFESLLDKERQVCYRLCMHCGLTFQSPRMSEAELSEFYQAEYRLLSQGREEPSWKDRYVQAARAEHLVEFCDGIIEDVENHLDIGSSSGDLLLAFSSKFGCASIGIEPGTAYRAFSQERGLTVYRTLDEIGERRFDLISLSHVLEHLHDPVAYLRMLRERWLTFSGCLLVEVPNVFGHESFEISHLYAFSRSTLKATLRAAGFSPIVIRTHGKPRSRLLKLYITSIAQEAGEGPQEVPSMRYFPSVRVRRKAAMKWSRLASRLAPSYAWLPLPEEN
jgi:hypothetical protein